MSIKQCSLMTVSLVCRLGQILGNSKNHWKNFQPITPLCLTLKEKIKPYDEWWGHIIHNVYYEFYYIYLVITEANGFPYFSKNSSHSCKRKTIVILHVFQTNIINLKYLLTSPIKSPIRLLISRFMCNFICFPVDKRSFLACRSLANTY